MLSGKVPLKFVPAAVLDLVALWHGIAISKFHALELHN